MGKNRRNKNKAVVTTTTTKDAVLTKKKEELEKIAEDKDINIVNNNTITDGESSDGESSDGESSDGESLDGESSDGESSDDSESSDGESSKKVDKSSEKKRSAETSTPPNKKVKISPSKEDESKGNKEEKDNSEANFEEEDKPNFYSNDQNNTFASLPLSEATQKGLAAMGYTRMTQIQSMSIPSLLAGKDLIGAAKTGSGKTLAFLIPTLELLYKARFTQRNGTGAIIILPTRELAMQIYGVCKEICTNGKHSQTYGLIMGGANRRTESEKLSKGVNMIICTPGRLLDHLQNTRGWVFRNLLAFIMDEADRILEQGFEDDLRTILKILPKERQTMLFSATQTKEVKDLARVSINQKTAVYVEVENESEQATVAGLEQGYVTCLSDKRFLLLFSFLKRNKKKKIMVFFSSCNSVKYHAELLNYIDIPVMDIHGRQKQVKRTTTFFKFSKCDIGTLLCTDVAARGLDIPKVDWIIQFDPPDDPKEYIHRVGRTARGATGSGRALLFLTPEETGFLRYLQQAKVTLNEYEFPTNKVANVQSQLQRLVEKNYYLHKAAKDAYRSYLLAYASHSHRDIFDVHELDLQAVGLAFGFTVPPRVDLAFCAKGRKQKVKGAARAKKYSGHKFSADNPYGMREKGDKRQFSH